MSDGFTRMLTATFSTKRSDSAADGKRGTPTSKLSNVACTPLSVVDSNTRQRLTLNTPHVLMQLFTQGTLDIEMKDVVVFGSREYPIKFIEPWPYFNQTRYRIIVEKLGV